ncbi:toxin-antitoxin system HicB family antitoxin [Paenibacillus sp. NPDC058071]|uniref:toxin-antitoxin system HicB family antitoxin n=1 Tax=Paenibacillus sp. NPDC058071 TaxID=3346326 RepID=UPI0036DD9EF1
MGKEKKAFALRLDPELHRALEQWANDEFRSVNGHIEYLLKEALGKAGRLPKPTPKDS